MTKDEFASTIALLTATVGKSMGKPQLQAWYAILGELTVEELRRGIVETLRHHQFAGFPPVGTILANAGATCDTGDTALLAWAVVRHAIGRVGGYESADFGPVVNATIRQLGGWPTVCATHTDEMQWLEKRFVAGFKAYSTLQVIDPPLAAHLPVIHETNNSRAGLGEFKVARIELTDGRAKSGIRMEQNSIEDSSNNFSKMASGAVRETNFEPQKSTEEKILVRWRKRQTHRES